MAGSVLGAALQLQQAALWHWAFYAGLLTLAACGWLALGALRWPSVLWLPTALLLGAMAGGGSASWRAADYAAGALSPAVEGRDLLVEGRVASMPQLGAGATRFAFELESARWARAADAGDGPSPQVPSRVSLGWYDTSTGPWARPAEEAVKPAALHAGERWRFAVRLRAPHGSLNPHGFDHELRLWEQGEHATGQVRAGVRDPAPERLGSTWRHPVERLRESVRDAAFERVDDPRRAGVVAALVTGDQNAIELLSYKGVVTPPKFSLQRKNAIFGSWRDKGCLVPSLVAISGRDTGCPVPNISLSLGRGYLAGLSLGRLSP